MYRNDHETCRSRRARRVGFISALKLCQRGRCLWLADYHRVSRNQDIRLALRSEPSRTLVWENAGQGVEVSFSFNIFIKFIGQCLRHDAIPVCAQNYFFSDNRLIVIKKKQINLQPRKSWHSQYFILLQSSNHY
jgi:hypothetical protein